MKRLSRRTLLAGTGTAALAAVAGCMGGDSEDSDDPEDPGSEETRWQDNLDVPESLVSALGFVYKNGEDELVLSVEEQSASGGDVVASFDDTLASADIESGAQFGPDTSGETPPVVVLVGEFELEPDADGSTNGSFTVHEVEGNGDGEAPESDLVEGGETVATNGDVLLVGTRDSVTATLDSHRSDQEPYLATDATARTILNELWAADAVALWNSDTLFFEAYDALDIDDVESLPTPAGLAFDESQDTMQWQFAAGTTDESVAEDLKTVAGAFSSLDPAAFDHRVTGGILVVEGAEAFDSPGDPDTPGLVEPRFETYDEQTGEVLLRFESGASVSVENVTVEIDGEPYEGDWARGAEELGEASQIAIDAGAIEPGDSLTLTYEGEDGPTSVSTGARPLLSPLPVEFSYDPAGQTATVTYRDGPPLSGERTDIRAGALGGTPIEVREPLSSERTASEDAGPEGVSQVDPLPNGLRKGDTVTVDDIDPGTRLSVVYERTDGGPVVIGSDRVRPPGAFTFDIDDGVLTVVRLREGTDETDRSGEGTDGTNRSDEGTDGTDRPDEGTDGTNRSDEGTDGTDRPDEGNQPDGEPLPAERYEVRIDGVPAETQWTDQGETIEPGETLAVGDIAAGSEASVVWVGETTEYELETRRVPPDIRVAASYDPAEQRLTLVHDGGESVEADALTVFVEQREERTVSWDGDTVAEGDELTVEEVPERTFVFLQFEGDRIFEPIIVPQLATEDVDEIVVGGE